MEFTVDLRPQEYRRAMLWHQYTSSLSRRLNDLVGWGVLLLAPAMIGVFALAAPEALSVWFWMVAAVALSYSSYTTLLMRYQIRRSARRVLDDHPALAGTRYRVHEQGLHLQWSRPEDAGGKGGEISFLPWKEISQVQEVQDLYLFFVSDEQILIIPKRCLPDPQAFRALVPSRCLEARPVA